MSTLVWETNSTVINHLRIRSPERDPHSVQLRLTAMLNATEFKPPALPASAILIVQRIGRELPPVRLDRHSVRPPAAWQASVSETLEVMARRAVRPVSGSTVPEGDSILFFDRSEILACLACDWIDGALLSRWWWRCLFPREDLVRALLSAWTESPQYIPTALERLARTGKAARFVRQLPPALVMVLIRAVLRAFALPDLERAIESMCDEALPVSMDLGPAPFAGEKVTLEKVEAGRHGAAPPWTPWVPEANGRELKLDQRVLLMVALMLQRAPHVVRKRVFAVELSQWGQAVPWLTSGPALSSPRRAFPRKQLAVDATAGDLAIPSGESSAEPETPSNASHGDVFEAESQIAPVLSLEHEEAASHLSIPLQPAFASLEEPAADSGTDAGTPVQPEFAVDSRTAEETDGNAPGGAIPVVEIATPSEFCLAQPFDGIEIETEFGGVFYLINVAIYLGLYGDFSTPAEPGIDLPVWDFLALTGSELTGGALRDDPVWTLLATLSGRSEGQEPGQDFDPPLDESLNTMDRRSRLPAWLSVVMDRIRARLSPALERERPSDPGIFLLRHHARVQATFTHLDVFLSLDELPVPIRIARLDRDPGWVPAAGRHIAFHFV